VLKNINTDKVKYFKKHNKEIPIDYIKHIIKINSITGDQNYNRMVEFFDNEKIKKQIDDTHNRLQKDYPSILFKYHIADAIYETYIEKYTKIYTKKVIRKEKLDKILNKL
jgi:hypothetical protein